MPKSTSRRSIVGLFLITGLGCGFMFLVVRLKSDNASSGPSDLVWKKSSADFNAAFSSDGKTIVLLGSFCQRFETQTGRLLSSWRVPSSNRTYLATDGHSVIMPEESPSGKPFQTKIVDVSPDGRAARPHTGTIYPLNRSLKGLDTLSGALQWTISLPADDKKGFYRTDEIVELPDSRFLLHYETRGFASREKTETLRLYSHKDGKLLRSGPSSKTFIDAASHGDKVIWPHVYRKNGNELSQTISSFETSKALELQEGSTFHKFEIPPGTHRQFWGPLVFNKSEKLLAGASRLNPTTFAWDSDVGRVYLWGATGKLLRTIQVHRFEPTALAFSPDGQFLAVGGNDYDATASVTAGRLFIYDVANLKLVKELSDATPLDNLKQPILRFSSPFVRYTPYTIPGYAFPIDFMIWSPDSHLLGAMDTGHVFKLWRVN